MGPSDESRREEESPHPADDGSVRRPPPGVSDTTIEALGSLSKALETVERARGALYTFHQLTGTADLELDRAVHLLREAGHGDWANRVATEILGRNVIPDHWTFQVVEAYERTYYEPFKELERLAVSRLAGSRNHLYEARLKEARRTAGHPDHTSGPG